MYIRCAIARMIGAETSLRGSVMARLRYGDFSVEELTAKIQAANCIALFKSGHSEHPAWTWNPEKLKVKPLEFSVEVRRLQYARAFVLQVKREMHQPPDR